MKQILYWTSLFGKEIKNYIKHDKKLKKEDNSSSPTDDAHRVEDKF